MTNENINLIEESFVQIKTGITINVDVGVKNITYVKKHYIQNPATCSWVNRNCLARLIDDDSVTICEEIIEETKIVAANFNGKSSLWSTKLLCFTYIYINYQCITESCEYLLLPDKI